MVSRQPKLYLPDNVELLSTVQPKRELNSLRETIDKVNKHKTRKKGKNEENLPNIESIPSSFVSFWVLPQIYVNCLD